MEYLTCSQCKSAYSGYLNEKDSNMTDPDRLFNLLPSFEAF